MKRIKKIHFTGIGGIGMCGIAEVMANQGYEVSGSDIVANDNTRRLRRLGARVHIGHRAEHVHGVDVLVASSAVDAANPELAAAVEAGIPVVPRAEMLFELMRMKQGIAVSGTHGKTTTTSMIASMLDAADMNPTYVIGGRLLHNDMNARLGDGEYFVAEADESDGSFLLFHPVISVVTNIDNDHLGVYRDSMNHLTQAFKKFINDIPFYGCAVLCADDERIRGLLPDIHRRVLSYGFADDATVRCASMRQDAGGVDMRVQSEQFGIDEDMRIQLYGRHNVLNALANVCVGVELGINTCQIKTALKNFQGIARRFNVHPLGLSGGRRVTVIDDYGHHPTEVGAVLQTAKEVFQQRRIILVFEPHRYSRVKTLFDGFVESMLGADYQFVLPIYAAGEADNAAVSSAALCDSLRSMGAADAHSIADPQSLFAALDRVARADDVILFMGAGGVGQIARQYIKEAGQ